MTAADGRTESRLCLNLLLQKLCGRKKLSRALGIEKNADRHNELYKVTYP